VWGKRREFMLRQVVHIVTAVLWTVNKNDQQNSHVNSGWRPRPIPSTSLPAAHRCKQWLRRSSRSLHHASHASIRPTVKTQARACSTTLPSSVVSTREQYQAWVLLAPRSGRWEASQGISIFSEAIILETTALSPHTSLRNAVLPKTTGANVKASIYTKHLPNRQVSVDTKYACGTPLIQPGNCSTSRSSRFNPPPPVPIE